MAKMEVLHLTPTERGELQSFLRKRNLPASVAQRMRIILLLDQGVSYREIEEQLGAFPVHDFALETAFRERWLAGFSHHPSWPATTEADSPVARQGTGEDAADAPGRLYALVATQDGGSHEGQQKLDRAHLEGSGSEASSAGALHGFQRSEV